jgi:hypothetical protein
MSIKFNKWSEPLCLYTLLVADPGEKKSAVLAKVRKPLYDWQEKKNKELAAQIKSSQRAKMILDRKLKKAEEKVANNTPGSESELSELYHELDQFDEVHEVRLFVDDVTTEKLASIMAQQGESISIVSSEGGIFQILAGRYAGGSPNIDLLLKSFNSEPCTVDRMSRSNVSLVAPKLSAFLSVQPHVLNEVLSNEAFRGLGLVDRFLYILPESFLGKSIYRTPDIIPNIERNYVDTIYQLLDRQDEQIVFQLSSAADKLFEGYFNEINGLRMLTDLNNIQGWAGKHCGIVGRIAGIIQAASLEGNYISGESMKSAINIGRYLIEHAKIVFDNAGVDENLVRARYILNRLKNNQARIISQREILRTCQGKGIRSVSVLISPLQILVERGYLRVIEESDSGEAHRPESPKYEVNPEVYK